MLIKKEGSYPIWMRSFIHKNYVDLITNFSCLIYITWVYDIFWFVPIAYMLSTALITIFEYDGDNVYGASIMVHSILSLGLFCPDNFFMTMVLIIFLYKPASDGCNEYNWAGFILGFIFGILFKVQLDCGY